MKYVYKILFWQNRNGDKPVAKWMKSLQTDDQVYLGDLFKDLALGGPRSNPKIFRHIEGELWEIRDLRSHSPGYRIYFGFDNSTVICLVVHSGDKKSQQRNIELAKKRLAKQEE